MSETEQPAPLWVWQGFFGPMPAAISAKASTDADHRCGAWVPLPDELPRAVDPKTHRIGMWAVQVRPDAQIPLSPEWGAAGILEADPAMVGRLLGA